MKSFDGDNRPWTADDMVILRAMKKQGKTASEIANRLGRSRSAVCGKAFRSKTANGSATFYVPCHRVTKRGQQVTDDDLKWAMRVTGIRSTQDLGGYHHFTGRINYLSSRRCLVAFLLSFKGYDAEAISVSIGREPKSIASMKSAARKMIQHGKRIA